MKTTNVDTAIEWINDQVGQEANEYVADNIIYAMEYAVNDMDPDTPMSALFETIADVTPDDVIPAEIVYTADVFDIYNENTNECDAALEGTVGDLSTFDTISEAMNAAVHAWLREELDCAVDMVTNTARDLAEEYEDAENEAEDAEDEAEDADE